MALRAWAGLIIDEQEHTYLLQWEGRAAATPRLVPSWIPKPVVTTSAVDIWQRSRAYRWKRARGDFPWSPPLVRSVIREPTPPIPPTSTNSYTSLPFLPHRQTSPTPELVSVPDRKRRKVDHEVATESVTVRLAMDGCLRTVNRAMNSYEVFQSETLSDLAGVEGNKDVAMRWSKLNGSLVDDARRAKRELSALVARASEEEQEGISDYIYGQELQRKLSDRISTIDAKLCEDSGNALHEGAGADVSAFHSWSKPCNEGKEGS